MERTQEECEELLRLVITNLPDERIVAILVEEAESNDRLRLELVASFQE